MPQQVAALREGNFRRFLELVKQSGYSSYMYLQNVIPAGYTEHQDVALSLALCEHYLQGKGAYRVHGGGFAGTVQAFVPFEILESFRAGIDAVLEPATYCPSAPRAVWRWKWRHKPCRLKPTLIPWFPMP